MIEIKDIENANVGTIPEAKTIRVCIDSNMSIVDIFNVIANSEILSSKDMYELGSYLRTFADFHTPVEQEPADRKIPYRGF